MPESLSYDVAIVGGGLVGLTLACALAKNRFHVAVIDTREPDLNFDNSHYDGRVSAISRASHHIFEHLNLWDAIKAERVSPYQRMQVWDQNGAGDIVFDARCMGESELGHIIENRVMLKALLTKVKHNDFIDYLCPQTCTRFHVDEDKAELTLQDGRNIHAKCIVGADGARSWLRDAAQFSVDEKSYDHEAIVTTIKTEKPHKKSAYQRFLTSGPLALLPLDDEYRCSIVWSTLPEEAKRLTDVDENVFLEELSHASDAVLGKVVACDKRFRFPLIRRHVKEPVQNRVVLIGDAAHSIHPLAGQGVNLGFLDAACLAQVLSKANEKQQDIGSLRVLKRFARWRKGENALMVASMGAFKELFMNDDPMVTTLRNAGLNITNKLPGVKQLFMKKAMGMIGDLPEMAKARF